MISHEIRARAFAMYTAGLKAPTIAKKLGLRDEDAIYRWRDRFDWDKKKEEILKWKEEYGELTDREQDSKIIESVLGAYALAMRQNQDEMIRKLNYKDVFDAIKMRRLIKGESTENVQINSEVNQVREEIKKIIAKGENE